MYFLAAAMTLVGFASCSSDDAASNSSNAVDSKVVSLAPAKSAEVSVQSNGQDVESDAVVTAKYEEVTYNTAKDAALMLKHFPEAGKNIPNFTSNFLYYAKDGDVTLTLTRIYQQTDQTHYLGIYYYNEKGEKVEQIITEQDMTQYTTGDWNTNEKAKRITVTVKKGYYFGFFINGRNNGENDGNLVNDNPSYPEKYYTQSELNNARNIYGGSGKESVHAGTKVLEGNTYLMFEDWTDFDCNDFAFRIEGTVETVEKPEKPNPTPDPTPEPEPEPEPTPTPEPTPDPTPDPVEPTVKVNGGSVEANFSIDEHDWDVNETHLSLHVRDTTDVTIFMPVEAEYYCAADDMNIVAKHDVQYVYNEATETVSMDVNGQTVTLNIKYAENGITVSTQGINAEVLKYCRDTYNDGITFEVRNYFNSNITKEALKQALDNSTISFTTEPKTYVNAFGFYNGVEDQWGIKVTPKNLDVREVPEAKVKSEFEAANLLIYPIKSTEAEK